MNGVHDMGGMHGFGPIECEHNEPVFHYRWEARTFALLLACGALGKWNIDISRHSRERIPPEEYLAATYYERWLAGLQRLLLESGLVTQSEIGSGQSAAPAPPGLGAFPPEKVEKAVRAGRNYRLDTPVPAAALRPWQARHSRPRPRRVHLSGHQCSWPGAEAAAPLQRAILGARVVGC